MIDRRLFLLWVRATWLGWLLGVPLIVVLALIGEALGIGGAQVMVGAGMGIGVGLMQWRVIRHVIHQSAFWFWSTIIGLTLPFLLVDISKLVGWEVGYYLPVCVTLGGVIAGGWQALKLRSRFRMSWLWVAASAVGWAMAAAAAVVVDHYRQLFSSVRGIAGAVLYLSIAAGGGLLLALVTGLCIAWMVKSSDKQATA